MGGEGSAGQSQGQGLCPGEAGVGTAATQVCLLQGGADATATLLQVPQPPPVGRVLSVLGRGRCLHR